VSARFVEVPADAIRQRLAAAGFRLLPNTRGEEVYERPHDRDPQYTIKIYSSIQRGAQGARGCGADAIRAVALLTVKSGKVYPIFKSSRVYRTGSVDAVLDRMIERARDAYARCNEHRKGRTSNGSR
jgi:hypothetical protein